MVDRVYYWGHSQVLSDSLNFDLVLGDGIPPKFNFMLLGTPSNTKSRKNNLNNYNIPNMPVNQKVGDSIEQNTIQDYQLQLSNAYQALTQYTDTFNQNLI